MGSLNIKELYIPLLVFKMMGKIIGSTGENGSCLSDFTLLCGYYNQVPLFNYQNKGLTCDNVLRSPRKAFSSFKGGISLDYQETAFLCKELVPSFFCLPPTETPALSLCQVAADVWGLALRLMLGVVKTKQNKTKKRLLT